MHRTTGSRSRKFLVRVAAAMALLVVASLTSTTARAQTGDPGPPSGAGIQPQFKIGNLNCAGLDAGKFELRINSPADGTFTDGTLTVTIDVRTTALGSVFDWTSNIGVDSVFVKGGPDGNFYRYDPPAEATSDTSLHSPINPNNLSFYGLSHISFCYDVEASVTVDKSGDELSKVGDDVTYAFTITNDGDVALTLDSVVDTLLGNLSATATAAGCGTLAAGASCNFTRTRTVQVGDPDPLPNTVTVTYKGTLPSGATTVVDSDSHSVNLFQPSIAVDKTGDELSKVGDDVNYTFTLSNNSSADTPALNCTAVDSLVGGIFDGVLPSGNTVINRSRTVLMTDPDPLPNTVTLTCSPAGFPNVLTASDDHSVNLFQPSVDVEKTGDETSKVGDDVTYTITVTNTSSVDSPGLVNGTIVDTLLGDLLDPANPFVTANDCTTTLAVGASCTITAVRTVLASDPDPLPNTVTAHYNPGTFPNDITDSDDHSVNLFQPSMTIAKTGDELSKIGDDVTYTITVVNTSSADSPNLDCTISDALIGLDQAVVLGAGEQSVISVPFTIP
ncbi:MAG TPA: choice-of-anchor D domain-containing protein, partial [Microthrixaceae bacterium]|nr:choice-of-anchor D domain-containing protein [Microthrixaceae bacterium]